MRHRRSQSLFALFLSLALVAVIRADGPPAWVDDLSPIAASDWNYERAAHLIERAGFGAAPPRSVVSRR